MKGCYPLLSGYPANMFNPIFLDKFIEFLRFGVVMSESAFFLGAFGLFIAFEIAAPQSGKVHVFKPMADLPVKDIVDRLHFEDASYMCRFFKCYTGMSLTAYRQKCKGRVSPKGLTKC